ncbi:MAG: hypothetical protein NTV34_17890 [Proteobacteria bacterium]|nr:hypothetical protein [Pseudomonadota bacterium]
MFHVFIAKVTGVVWTLKEKWYHRLMTNQRTTFITALACAALAILFGFTEVGHCESPQAGAQPNCPASGIGVMPGNGASPNCKTPSKKSYGTKASYSPPANRKPPKPPKQPSRFKDELPERREDNF